MDTGVWMDLRYVIRFKHGNYFSRVSFSSCGWVSMRQMFKSCASLSMLLAQSEVLFKNLFSWSHERKTSERSKSIPRDWIWQIPSRISAEVISREKKNSESDRSTRKPISFINLNFDKETCSLCGARVFVVLALGPENEQNFYSIRRKLWWQILRFKPWF